MSTCQRFLGNFFNNKDLHSGFSRYIITNMNENYTFCSAIQAVFSSFGPFGYAQGKLLLAWDRFNTPLLRRLVQ